MKDLQTACRLALALGQDPKLIEQIERGEVHPAMAAFGLWRDDPSLDNITEEIYQRRHAASERPEVDL
jgi:hypothetical protein